MSEISTEFAFAPEFVVVRKPWQRPETFDCVICLQTREFQWREQRLTRASRMVCDACALKWGNHLGGRYRATRGDRRQFQRLSALTNALVWEIHNGKNRRRFASF